MSHPDDSRAIEALIYAYAERIDAGDFAEVGELFRNGGIQVAPGVLIEGEVEVKRLYERTTRLYEDGTPRTRHVTTNVVVDVDDAAVGVGDAAATASATATAKSYFTVFQQTDELPLQAIIAGHYSDSFHRVGSDWCFNTREIFVDLTGDLSKHLLFELK